MGNGVAAAIRLAPEHAPPGAISGDELAHGLMLVRSSAMKLARLHLAMERRDRRLVLETMDDLSALDRQIQDFVDEIPTSDSGIAALQDELERQKNALAREKLALAAGIIRKDRPRSRAEASAGLEYETAPEPQMQPGSPEAGFPIHADHPVHEEWIAAWQEEAPRARTGFILTLTGIFLLVGSAALFITEAGREIVAPILRAIGV